MTRWYSALAPNMTTTLPAKDGGGRLRGGTGRGQPEHDAKWDRGVERELMRDAAQTRLDSDAFRAIHDPTPYRRVPVTAVIADSRSVRARRVLRRRTSPRLHRHGVHA